MARCTNCNYKWKFRDVWQLGWSKDGKDCPNCGKRQYISQKTQNTFTLGYLSLIFILIFPFIIKLSNKKEEI